MSGIEPWALFRLVSTMVRNVTETDKVANAEEGDRGWLTLDLATTVAVDVPPAYVVTVHRADLNAES